MTNNVCLITYTTLYREGGAKFERAAKTLAALKAKNLPGVVIELKKVESKLDFVEATGAVAARGAWMQELHFIGHSGMYGPMFRTVAMPEQFSPYEWRTLPLAFAPGGEAFFHACRSARWFAPFFARTFRVPAHGNHWYTTVSLAPTRFKWEGRQRTAPLFVIGCKGKKSHGLVGAVAKYVGLTSAERMRRCLPTPPEGDPTYDAIAPLYDEVFEEIGVRGDEWRWIERHLPTTANGSGLDALDIGCGNGALLRKMAPRLASGTGIDASPVMIELAKKRAAALPPGPTLTFIAEREPRLPFPDASFDVVTSLLSFRYLDWDPIMNEIRRVLRPGGRILIVDMVTIPSKVVELPAILAAKFRSLLAARANPKFRAALRRLVADPRWRTMLAYNPIRAEHEFKWYLESRFPGQSTETLNVGVNSRILAFDSGQLAPGFVAPQSYP